MCPVTYIKDSTLGTIFDCAITEDRHNNSDEYGVCTIDTSFPVDHAEPTENMRDI